MTETGFGGGGYGYTGAITPSPPALSDPGSTTVLVTIGADDENPAYTEYAVFAETDDAFIDASGNKTDTAVWQTRASWGSITACGLTAATEHTFRVKARNQDGVETDFGPGAVITTAGLGNIDAELSIEVRKASSTISAPVFMSGLAASIRLAGKSLNDFGFHVDHISGLDLPRVVPDEELVPGDHTWHIWDEYFAPKRIVLEGYVHGSSPDDLRLRLAYLKSFLATFEGNPWRSTAPVRLERSDLPDRHWDAYYDAIGMVETLGKRDISSSARISVTMKCPMPYGVSNDVIRAVFAPDAGSFLIIDLGNAPSDCVYVIKGEAVNPSFTVGDMVFHCDFSDGLSFTDVERAAETGTYNPPENEAGAYRTTETGLGILVTGTDTVTYTAQGNPVNGSWVAVVIPQWQSSVQADDVVILEHRYDADNYLRLYWDASEDAWVFRKRAGGETYEVSSTAQAFIAGTRIIIGITYDSTNAGGMKLFIDGEQAGVGGNMSVLAGTPTALTLHENGGTMQPDVIFDMVAGWSRMLSADEMLKIASNPQAVANLNVTAGYTGTLAENDMLTLDSRFKTASLFDVSEGTRSNVLGSVSGTIPILTPGRRKTATDRTQTVIYTKNSAAQMEIRYRRRYL
ncbi:hypothetical protein LLG96_02050 [bacterium]|nr:hypothetical protein [bacterium]